MATVVDHHTARRNARHGAEPRAHIDDAEGKLGGYRIEGYWKGIDTVKDVIEAAGKG